MDFRRRKLRVAVAILVAGIGIAMLWHSWFRWVEHLGYPYNSFLFKADARGTDFFDGIDYALLDNPYHAKMGYCNFFPAAYLVFDLFTGLPKPLALFVYWSITMFGLWVLMMISLEKILPVVWQRIVIGLVVAESYPVLCSLDRGNLEFFIVLLVATSLFFYSRKRFGLSLGFLLPTIYFKLFPIVLLLLFVRRKWLPWAVVGAVLFVPISLAILMTYPGSLGENIKLLVTQVAVYNLRYNLGPHGISASASAWNLYRVLVAGAQSLESHTFVWPLPLATGLAAMKVYSMMAACGGVMVAGYALLIETTFARRAAVILCYVMVSTPGGGDYKLMHGVVALFLLILATESRRGDLVAVALLAFVLIPKREIILTMLGKSDSQFADVPVAIILNPLGMLAVMAILMWNACLLSTPERMLQRCRKLFWALRLNALLVDRPLTRWLNREPTIEPRQH